MFLWRTLKARDIAAAAAVMGGKHKPQDDGKPKPKKATSAKVAPKPADSASS